jgi:hypothetical protein
MVIVCVYERTIFTESPRGTFTRAETGTKRMLATPNNYCPSTPDSLD